MTSTKLFSGLGLTSGRARSSFETAYPHFVTSSPMKKTKAAGCAHQQEKFGVADHHDY
jgi:hypothetical protein